MSDASNYIVVNPRLLLRYVPLFFTKDLFLCAGEQKVAIAYPDRPGTDRGHWAHQYDRPNEAVTWPEAERHRDIPEGPSGMLKKPIREEARVLLFCSSHPCTRGQFSSSCFCHLQERSSKLFRLQQDRQQLEIQLQAQNNSMGKWFTRMISNTSSLRVYNALFRNLNALSYVSTLSVSEYDS